MNPRKSAKRSRVQSDGSDDMATDKTRVRVSRACNECRKRKDRCDGLRPICDSCARKSRICNYKPSRKRGLRTGYVRALETLLAMTFSTIQGSEEWLSSLLAGQETSPAFHPRSPSSPPAVDTIEILLDAWRKSDVLKQVEQLLSPTQFVYGEEEDEDSNNFDRRASNAISVAAKVLNTEGAINDHNLPLGFPPSPMDTGSTSPIVVECQSVSGPPLATMLPFPATNSSLLINAVSQEQETTIRVPCAGHLSGQRDSGRNTCSILPTDWQPLLDLYFANTHCWFPISQKHDLLRTAYTIANPTRSPEKSAPQSLGDLAFLKAVLKYASIQKASQSRHIPIDARQNQAELLSGMKMRLFPDDPGLYELGHVRALLIQALVRLYFGHRQAAWSAVGRAVYTVVSLNGSPFKEPRLESTLDDGMKRTIMCCIVMDSLVASLVRVRPYFQRSDISRIGPLPIEGIEEWEPWQRVGTSNNYMASLSTPAHVLSTFNRFIEYVGILNDFLRLPDGELRADELRGLSRRVQAQHLPSQCSSTPASNSPPQFFSIQVFSASIFETIRVHGMHLDGVESDSRVVDSSTRIRQLSNLLREYAQSTGPHLMPPTFSVYLFLLDISLKHLMKYCQSPRVRKKLEDVQNCMLEPFRPRQDVAMRLQIFGEESSNIIPQTQEMTGTTVDSSSTQIPQPKEKDDRIDISIPPLDAGFTMQSQDTNILPVDDPNFHTPSWNLLAQSQRNVYTNVYTQTPAHISQEQQPIDQDLRLNPVTDFISGNMDEDGLFQSLADLDSSEWSANPPDFMRHLGILSDNPTDLHTFFDHNPGR